MATTIEERAKNYSQGCEYLNGDTCYVQKECRIWGYQAGATEQDAIARAEERARCIKVAQEWLCKVCYDAPHCDHNPIGCCQCEGIREAMEGGNK